MRKLTVTIYMAISTDNYICDKNGKTPWSTAEWKLFFNAVKKTKNLVIGRKTYEIMKKQGEFAKFPPCRIIVVSKQKKSPIKSPQKAIAQLEKEGFSNVLVGGGQKLNTSFLNAKLVTGLILDRESIRLKKGKRLFANTRTHHTFTFVKSRKYKTGVQETYQINN